MELTGQGDRRPITHGGRHRALKGKKKRWSISEFHCVWVLQLQIEKAKAENG